MKIKMYFLFYFNKILECIAQNKCNGDVACIARCFNVPAPTYQQVNDATSCINTCKGNAACYTDCINKHYMGNETGEVYTDDKPAADKPTEDKPADDKPAADKPTEDKPADDKPAADKPTEDKPAEDKPADTAAPNATAAAPATGATTTPVLNNITAGNSTVTDPSSGAARTAGVSLAAVALAALYLL